MVISNCTRCTRVFQKSHSPLCPDCERMSHVNFSQVYRFVQDNPAVTLEEIAQQCQVPLHELRTLFFKGALGTATKHVIYHCQGCQIPLALMNQRGRFCLNCSEKLGTEAGLATPKTHQETDSSPPSETTAGKQARKEPLQAEASKRFSDEYSGENYGFKPAT